MSKYARSLSFYGFYCFMYAILRIYFQQEVNMIRHNFHFEKINMDFMTRFFNQLL